MVHVSEVYSNILSTQALKKEILVALETPYCQILCSLLLAVQARPFLERKSFSLSAKCDPRYLKSSTFLMMDPSFDRRGWWCESALRIIHSVFLAFSIDPLFQQPLPVRKEVLEPSSSAVRTRSSAQSRSVRCFASCCLDLLSSVVKSFELMVLTDCLRM